MYFFFFVKCCLPCVCIHSFWMILVPGSPAGGALACCSLYGAEERDPSVSPSVAWIISPLLEREHIKRQAWRGEREIAASVTDKSVAQLVCLTAQWAGERESKWTRVWGKERCTHTHAHTQKTLTQADPSAWLHTRSSERRLTSRRYSMHLFLPKTFWANCVMLTWCSALLCRWVWWKFGLWINWCYGFLQTERSCPVEELCVPPAEELVSCLQPVGGWRSCQEKTRSWYEAAGRAWARTKFLMVSSCFPGSVLHNQRNSNGNKLWERD